MMMTKSLRLFFTFLIAVAIQGALFAQEESVKIEKLSIDADVIFSGKVTQKESHWNESKTKIFTTTTLSVEEPIKGAENQISVDVITLGGEVGDVGEIYSHMPQFEENEEVLVFLKKDINETGYRVLNGKEGKIPLRIDKKSKQKITGSNMKFEVLKSKINRALGEK